MPSVEQDTFNQSDNGSSAIVAGTNHRNMNNLAFRNDFLYVCVLKHNRNSINFNKSLITLPNFNNFSFILIIRDTRLSIRHSRVHV